MHWLKCVQKSLVILAHRPSPDIFSALLDSVAPVFFRHGLSAACAHLASSSPTGSGISGASTINGATAEPSHRPHLALPLKPTPPHPLRIFRHCLPSLWVLWECMILGEPLIIFAPDPSACSDAVWCLLELIRPISTAGDFRPYMHIHDFDCPRLVSGAGAGPSPSSTLGASANAGGGASAGAGPSTEPTGTGTGTGTSQRQPEPGVVVGVTNPFFRQAAAHWPNVLTLGTGEFKMRVQRSLSKDRVALKRWEAMAAEGREDGESRRVAARRGGLRQNADNSRPR